MDPADLQSLLARRPDPETLLLEHLLCLALSGQARLLMPGRPGEAADLTNDVGRLTRAIGPASLGLVRLKKLQAGPDLQSGDFILRLPNRRRARADLRLRWPGHPPAANDDVQFDVGTKHPSNDVQFAGACAGLVRGHDVQFPLGTTSTPNDVQFAGEHAGSAADRDVQFALGTQCAPNDVQSAAPPVRRGRGAPPGNTNRLVHGRRSAAAMAARGESRRLVRHGKALLRAIAQLTSPAAECPRPSNPLPSPAQMGFLPP